MQLAKGKCKQNCGNSCNSRCTPKRQHWMTYLTSSCLNIVWNNSHNIRINGGFLTCIWFRKCSTKDRLKERIKCECVAISVVRLIYWTNDENNVISRQKTQENRFIFYLNPCLNICGDHGVLDLRTMLGPFLVESLK